MVFPSLPSESEHILDTGESPSELMSGLRGTLFNLKMGLFPLFYFCLLILSVSMDPALFCRDLGLTRLEDFLQ